MTSASTVLEHLGFREFEPVGPPHPSLPNSLLCPSSQGGTGGWHVSQKGCLRKGEGDVFPDQRLSDSGLMVDEKGDHDATADTAGDSRRAKGRLNYSSPNTYLVHQRNLRMYCILKELFSSVRN